MGYEYRHTLPDRSFYGDLIFEVGTSDWECLLGNGLKIEAKHGNGPKEEYIYDPVTVFRLYQVADSLKNDLLAVSEFKTDKLKFDKLKIKTSRVNTRLTTSNGEILFDDVENIPPLKPGADIVFSSVKDGKVSLLKEEVHILPERKHVEIPDSLPCESHLHTGLWSYLDRITPVDGSVVAGGRYRLALLDNPEEPGGFVACYFDGAEIDGNIWERGDIKAILRPTAFSDHYDVEWYDSRHERVDMNECSAIFEGTNLLTVDFPLLKSQLRFQRFIPRP